MAFLSEPEPARLTAITVRPGVRRMVAPNPGPMTYTGTNTWLIDEPDGLTIIDPGPDDPAHISALAATGPIARIVLTHTHPDHLAGAPALQAATGAPIHAWHAPWAAGLTPEMPLDDGAQIGRLTALHTPGHASDHLCFALAGERVLFTGDLVMSWSTTVVSPPDGDMAAYMASLRLLLTRDDTLYLCGHGPPLPNPAPLVRGMLAHRAGREAAILAILARHPASIDDMVAGLYAGLEPHLLSAARRTVVAHVLSKSSKRKAASSAARTRDTRQSRRTDASPSLRDPVHATPAATDWRPSYAKLPQATFYEDTTKLHRNKMPNSEQWTGCDVASANFGEPPATQP